jgi:hypothetical protein
MWNAMWERYTNCLHNVYIPPSAGRKMIAVERTLFVKKPNGASEPILIQVEVPISIAGSWRCDYVIFWPDGACRDYGMGFDSVQALYFALQAVGMRLYASRYHVEATLSWDKTSLGYGFPLPNAARAQAVGDDKRL